MIIKKTNIKDCLIIEPKVFTDERGYFFESYNKDKLDKELGFNVNFIQDNQSSSTYGVLRGLHFQAGDNAQAKLVSVISGKVLDIAVDLRKNSTTFGEYVSIELSSENKKQLFIPRGFAHGFVVLSKTAEFYYKIDNYYAPQSERGIIFNDPDLNINWQFDLNDMVLNKKDRELPLFKNVVY